MGSRFTRTDQEPGERTCGICEKAFPLLEATLWAVSDENILLGEMCPCCLEGGSERIQAHLDKRARIARLEADEVEEIASEGVGELPSLDALFMAERVYADGAG